MSPDDTTPDSTHNTTQTEHLSSLSPRAVIPRVVGYGLLVCLVAVSPAAAQETTTNFVCDAEKLPGMIEAFFRITTIIGLMGLIIVWQGSSLLDVFTLNPEQKIALKNHRRRALKSTVVILSIGPLFTAVGPSMGLPLASCINLVPW